jgi:dihydroxy-acid dehydratase
MACLHGDALTITGETIEQKLAEVPEKPAQDQDVIRQWDDRSIPKVIS